MKALIGHASIDERGKAKGGASGDQTGKEVCIREWYNKLWSFALRCKEKTRAEAMACACERACKNENIGYDQNQRNTLRTQAKKVGFDLSKIYAKCETDCSAFMSVCAEAAGINIPYNKGNAPTTSTMKDAFMSTGKFELLTDKKYLASDKYLNRGDILVKPGSHTVMVIEGGEYGEKSYETSYYTRKDFIKDVQGAIGAKQDGIAGKETLSKTITISSTINNRHPAVKPIQRYLKSMLYPVGDIDGIAGKKFRDSVKSYQEHHGCVADGEITAREKTWKSLLGMI